MIRFLILCLMIPSMVLGQAPGPVLSGNAIRNAPSQSMCEKVHDHLLRAFLGQPFGDDSIEGVSGYPRMSNVVSKAMAEGKSKDVIVGDCNDALLEVKRNKYETDHILVSVEDLVSSGVGIAVHDPNPAISFATACEPLDMCSAETVTEDIENINAIVEKSLSEEEKYCSCVKSNSENLFPGVSERKKTTDELRLKMVGQVMESFGEKFINQYSAHLEEIRYFGANAKTAFSDSSVDSKVLKNLQRVQCSEPELYNQAIEKKCKSNKIEDSLKEKRLSDVFKLLKDNSHTGLENHLNRLNYELNVNSLDKDESEIDSKGIRYHRQDFDATRKGLVLKDESIHLVDSVMAEIMSDQEAMAAIKASKRATPALAVLGFIGREIEIHGPEKFIQRYIKKGVVSEARYNQFTQETLSDPFAAINKIRKSLEYTMQIHPGFGSVMQNSELFAKTSSKLGDSRSIIKVIENRDDLMQPVFAERCENLVADLAAAVCMKEEDILDNVPKEELRGLIKKTAPPGSESLIENGLICEARGIVSDAGPFSYLATNNPSQKISDTIERLKVPKIADHKNLFTKFMLAAEEDKFPGVKPLLVSATVEGYKNQTAIKGDNFNKSFGSSSREGAVSFLSERNGKSGEAGKVESKLDAISENKSDSKNNSLNSFAKAIPDQDIPAQIAPTRAGSTANFANPTKSSPAESTDNRNSVRDFIAENSSNKTSVTRMVNEADKSSIDEIYRLKERAANKRMQDLLTENENLKLKNIQDKIATLEDRQKELLNSQGETSAKPRERRSSVSGAAIPPAFESATNSQADAGLDANGVSQSQTRASAAGIRGGSKISSAALGDSVSQAERVVISASGVKAPGLEIKSSEITQELMSYLSANTADINTLMKIKNSGMIYKYKVLENGIYVDKEVVVDYATLDDRLKELIDNKIAANSSQNLENEIRILRKSYVSTLRSLLLNK